MNPRNAVFNILKNLSQQVSLDAVKRWYIPKADASDTFHRQSRRAKLVSFGSVLHVTAKVSKGI
jgi:hypothetical protein